MHILNLFLWNKCHLLTRLSITLSKKAYMHAYPEFVPLKQMSSADYVVTYFIKKGIYACISWICSFQTNVICWPCCHILYWKRHICMYILNLLIWNKCHLLTTLSLTLSKKAYMHAFREFVPLKQMSSADYVVTYFIKKGIYACISWICSFETNVICWLRCHLLYQKRHICMHILNLFLWNKCHLLPTLSLTLSEKAYMHAYPEFVPLKQMSSADYVVTYFIKKGIYACISWIFSFETNPICWPLCHLFYQKRHICMHILILFLWNKCHLLTTLSIFLSKKHICMHILNLFLWNKCHLLTALSLTLSKMHRCMHIMNLLFLKQMSSADYVVTYFIKKGIYACISWICSFETNAICWQHCHLLYRKRHICMHILKFVSLKQMSYAYYVVSYFIKKGIYACIAWIYSFETNVICWLGCQLLCRKRHICMHIQNLFLWNKCHLLTTLSLTLSEKAYMHAYPEFDPLKKMSSAYYVVTYLIKKRIYACISRICSSETNVICWLRCHLLYQKRHICMHILNLILWKKCHLLTTLLLTWSKKEYMHAYPEFVPLKQMSSADYVVTYFIKRHICMHILNLFLWHKCHLLTTLSHTLSKKAYMHAYPEFVPLKQMSSADYRVTYFIEKVICACISWICSFETNVICWLRCHLLYRKLICADRVVTYFIIKDIYAWISWIC